VHLEANTKPPIQNLIHELLINMAFTMAYPNFKKGLKMAFGPLGVNINRCEIRRQPKQGYPRFATLQHLILVDSYTMIRGEGINFEEFGKLAKNLNLTL
jgi:hypothetical protein